ncbi:MAG TPA: hypothetical protein DEB39_01545 [Planctomycetaceae bacterium]|nr:hypothetical protein [Planctomycetaceae bacterium]
MSKCLPFGGLTLAFLLGTTLAFCQEKAATETKIAAKIADELVARFAENDFSDTKMTRAMKEAKAGDIAQKLWEDFTKQFGEFVESKAVKTESVLEFKRVHEKCEFERGSVTFMVVVDKNDSIAGLFVVAVDEKTNKKVEKSDDVTTTLKDFFSEELRESNHLKWYTVKKRIADFPADQIDLSSPEASYATQKNLLVSDAKDRIEQLEKMTVGRGKMSERERKSLEETCSADFAKQYRNEFVVFEVFVLHDKLAFVFGLRTYDGLYDGNFFRKEGDEWLNNGNEQSMNAEEIGKQVDKFFGRLLKLEKMKKMVEEFMQGADESTNQRLTGKVTFADGTPVTSGLIVYSSPTFQARATIAKDGTYVIAGIVGSEIPPDDYTVYFKDTDEINAKYLSSETSGLRISIENGTHTVDFMVGKATEKPADESQQ